MDSAILTQQIRLPVYPSRTGIVLNGSTDRHVSVALAPIYTFQDFTYLFSLLDEHIFWLHRRICLICDTNCCWPIYVRTTQVTSVLSTLVVGRYVFSTTISHSLRRTDYDRNCQGHELSVYTVSTKKRPQACLKIFKIRKLCTITI